MQSFHVNSSNRHSLKLKDYPCVIPWCYTNFMANSTGLVLKERFVFKARAYISMVQIVFLEIHMTLKSVNQEYKLHGNTWCVIFSKNVASDYISTQYMFCFELQIIFSDHFIAP